MVFKEDFILFFSVKNALKKNLVKKVRTVIPAQTASVMPPLGPVLGQLGINIVEFCKQFNEKSKHFKKNVLLNVIIVVYKDKSFSFLIKAPTVSFLFYEFFSNFQNEENFPNRVPLSFFYKIVEHRLLCNRSFQSKRELASCLRGTLRSMHLKIYDDLFFGSKLNRLDKSNIKLVK